MLDDTSEFLVRSGKEAWHINESNDWQVERVAEPRGTRASQVVAFRRARAAVG